MSAPHLTLTATLSVFITSAKHHGLNPYKYLAMHNIDPKRAKANERNLPLTDLIKLLDSVCKEQKSYRFVLAFAKEYNWVKLDAKAMAFAHQDNLYTLTLVLNALLKEQGSGIELALKQQGSIATYLINLPTLPEVENTTYKLLMLAVWDRVMSKVIGSSWHPKKVFIKGQTNSTLIQTLKINNTAISTGKNHNAIEFDASLLHKKVSTAVTKSPQMVKTYSAILGNIATDVLTSSAIKMIIGAGDVSIEYVAAILGTTPRVLQLKLKALNTSFSALLSACRITIATELLQSTSYKVSEIAFLLAFNSPEAFVRFFKKHQAITPLAWRKSNLSATKISGYSL